MDLEEDTDVSIDTCELDHIVSLFKVSKMEQIGSLKWFEKTKQVSKLYRVALAESVLDQPSEERVKLILTTHGKFDHMVHELITIHIWKQYALKNLLKIKPGPKISFPTYIVMYYEVIVHGIIQAMIYHGETFNYLRETCDDLVEYCVTKLKQLLRPIKDTPSDNVPNMEIETIQEIEQQNMTIDFNMGSLSITTLRHVCEHLQDLPVSVSTRIYSTHDLPVLVAQIMYQNVWTKKEGNDVYKYRETDWQKVRNDDPPLSKMECQVWLLLRQMLLNAAAHNTYHYSDYRKSQLTKLLKYLNDKVLDQLSVLDDLQRLLLHLQVRTSADGDKSVYNPLIMDITPLYQDQLVEKYKDQWCSLAAKHSLILFTPDKEQTIILAKAFSDSITFLTNECKQVNSCSYCMKSASNRCSKCKQVWYCSRSCQVQHWKIHKNSCSETAIRDLV